MADPTTMGQSWSYYLLRLAVAVGGPGRRATEGEGGGDAFGSDYTGEVADARYIENVGVWLTSAAGPDQLAHGSSKQPERSPEPQ